MMKHLKSVLTLVIIISVVSVALAVCFAITDPIIKEQQAAAASGALLEVMPDGGSFEKMDISSYELPASIVEVNKAANGGYVFQVSFSGFNPGNVAMIGVSAEGKITGTKCITNAESSGFGADRIPELDAKGHYNGADATTIDGVDTVAGCTVSTKAYRAVVKDALNAALILGGGEVDLRTPEQILNENLNAALGTEGVEFDKHFFAEIVEGVDAIYVAKNGAGHVVVIGEEFIGIDAEGKTVGTANELAEAAVATIKATTLTDVDLTKYEGLSKRVKSAKVTDAGVYVIEVEGAGFGINGDSHYGASGEYIVIRVAITKDGTVVDCYTVSQKETNGFGSVCADEEFYSQYTGKTEADYKGVIIAGSTITTKGYQGAILNAFKAVTIFEGGAK